MIPSADDLDQVTTAAKLHFPLVDLHAHIAQHVPLAVALGDVLAGYQGHAGTCLTAEIAEIAEADIVETAEGAERRRAPAGGGRSD